jgi:hypothetical protein
MNNDSFAPCLFPRLAVLGRLAVIVGSLIGSGSVWAGSVFITGHDPIWHSNFSGNSAGAIKLGQTMIEYARNGSTLPFLYIESKFATIPSGNAREAPFLTSRLGYASTDYVVMDAADLGALSNFRTALNSYSAIVVASDHGGMLTSAELSFLNADIIDYVNAGGGLAASAESNATGLLGATAPFGFLPFLVTSTSFQAAEVSNTVTALGTSLGLVNSDVNGNFSHNYFSSTGGMTPVDLFNGDPSKPLSLASRSVITVIGVSGVPDAGSTVLLLAMGLGAIALLLPTRKRVR